MQYEVLSLTNKARNSSRPASFHSLVSLNLTCCSHASSTVSCHLHSFLHKKFKIASHYPFPHVSVPGFDYIWTNIPGIDTGIGVVSLSHSHFVIIHPTLFSVVLLYFLTWYSVSGRSSNFLLSQALRIHSTSHLYSCYTSFSVILFRSFFISFCMEDVCWLLND